MGRGISRLLARAGHKVVFSGSRSPDKLAHAAELAGHNARIATIFALTGVLFGAEPLGVLGLGGLAGVSLSGST